MKRQEGQGLVEYALILVLVAIVIIAVLLLVGPVLGNIMSTVSGEVKYADPDSVVHVLDEADTALAQLRADLDEAECFRAGPVIRFAYQLKIEKITSVRDQAFQTASTSVLWPVRPSTKWTAQAMQGSNECTVRRTSRGCSGSATSVPINASSHGPRWSRASRGEPFQVVGTTA